jgi:hypothetical protein
LAFDLDTRAVPPLLVEPAKPRPDDVVDTDPLAALLDMVTPASMSSILPCCGWGKGFSSSGNALRAASQLLMENVVEDGGMGSSSGRLRAGDGETGSTVSIGSSDVSGVGQIPNCSYRSKKLELVGGDARLMLVERERGRSFAVLELSITGLEMGAEIGDGTEIGSADGDGVRPDTGAGGSGAVGGGVRGVEGRGLGRAVEMVRPDELVR